MASSDISPGSTEPASDTRDASRIRELFGKLQNLSNALLGVHAGVVTLAAGTSGAIAAPWVTAQTRIVATPQMPTTPGAGSLTVEYGETIAARVPGASFTLEAMVAAGTINVLDLSTLEWLAMEPNLLSNFHVGVTPALGAGTTTVLAPWITTTTRIVAMPQMPTTPGAGNLTVGYGEEIGNRALGVSFDLTAFLAAGTINVLDLSVLEWMAVDLGT